MHRRQELHKPYFISDELKKMLSLIPAYPLTLIEAPSGFGKTTAVKEFLKDIHAVHYWYTCIGKPAFYTWRAIASLILQSDSESAANPIKTAFDNEAVLLSVSNLIQNIRCENDTYLVIDNYHLSGFEAGYDVINLLSMHGNPRLHFIFITQQPVTGKHEFFHNPNIHKIEGSSFLISREGTLLLFKNHGIKLSTEELDKVCKYTEGWAAAIQFQITNYKSLGSLHQSTDIELVFESTVWNKLDNEAREFLLCISVFSSFSLGQAVYMSGKESLNEKQLHLLKHWIFIKYAPDEDVFTLHSVLQSFLKTQLNALYSTEARNLLFKKAGRACQAEGKLYQAAQFYYSIKDYEAILSLPFNIQLFANQKDTLLLALLEKVVNHCPTEIMRLYPYSLIILAYPFVYEQKLETAAKITNIVSYALDQNLLNLEAGELNNLKGEFLLMKSNVTYANVRLMHESRKEAYALFQGESRTITKDIISHK
jgi:LuxR family maltose regulon positive regulatory protein